MNSISTTISWTTLFILIPSISLACEKDSNNQFTRETEVKIRHANQAACAEQNKPHENTENIITLNETLRSAVNFKRNLSQVENMLAAKADVNYRGMSDSDYLEWTPLFWALQYKNKQDPDTTVAIVKALVNAQADVNIRDSEGQTPLLRAVYWAKLCGNDFPHEYPYEEIFELLFNAGLADIAATATASGRNLLTLTDTRNCFSPKTTRLLEDIRKRCLKYRELSYNNMKEKQSYIIHTIVPIMPRVVTRIIADYEAEYPFEKELGRPDNEKPKKEVTDSDDESESVNKTEEL